MKGCPYDNAVAEATYKIMKTEFVNQMTFQSLRNLILELCDYINWFNKHRIHGTLGYLTLILLQRVLGRYILKAYIY
ncbi:IS3 family transposase [Paenibacillus sp. NPDC058071]|uniref:IS3 family transposase n=1 Tax=Paenibacillus sp. NPDC058071 TaxID=3346326 RepID=UPI0036DC4B37